MDQDFHKQRTQIGNKKPPLPPIPHELPKKIGPYKIESLLSRGSMSLLYLGTHSQTQEPLVIKVLSSKYLLRPTMVERFLKEAEIIELTNHPNIIKLYGQGRWEQGVYIATEFVQGISLRQMILMQSMSLKRAIDIVLQTAHALVHLHANGIIHRDLKPENILITAQGGVKVIDFGISLLYTEATESALKRGFEGTPVYMSPEQRADPLNVTFSSDIYSLGIIAYELILGRLSYGTVHLSLMPQGLQKVLAKALAPKPEERYEDIVDFVKELSLYRASQDLKKELRGSDYLAEVADELKGAQILLAPQIAPDWSKLEVSITNNCTSALSSLYYDFFTQKEGHYTIALGESLATGVEGLLQIAILKGMVRSLASLIEDPKELVEQLHNQLTTSGMQGHFAFVLLTLCPLQDLFSYVGCGAIPLWHITPGTNKARKIAAENPPLGSPHFGTVMVCDGNFNIGDTLFLNTVQASALTPSEAEHTQEIFLNALQDNIFLSLKKQAEHIFRVISMKEAHRPLALLGIERLS